MNLISKNKEIRISYVFNVDGELVHHVEYEKENGKVIDSQTFFDKTGDSVDDETKEKIEDFIDKNVAFYRPDVMR